MSTKFSLLQKTQTLNCRGRLLPLNRPLVMGILNLTPDSFYDGGRYATVDAALTRAEQMLSAGAAIIDLGAYSSRPGAKHITLQKELERLLPSLEAIIARFPDAIVSIDTFRSGVAEKALAAGAHIINDISGGNLDAELPNVAAHCHAPYICMHMKGTPQTMQQNLEETACMPSLLSFFAQRMPELVSSGLNDVIIDPGFGFGKTLKQNYEMVDRLTDLAMFGKPVMVGISNKSMVKKKYGESPEQQRKGNAELHRQLLQNGADILRVHDVKEAVVLIA